MPSKAAKKKSRVYQTQMDAENVIPNSDGCRECYVRISETFRVRQMPKKAGQMGKHINLFIGTGTA
jgi:hypothetical protein